MEYFFSCTIFKNVLIEIQSRFLGFAQQILQGMFIDVPFKGL